jgi:hypothetical protein
MERGRRINHLLNRAVERLRGKFPGKTGNWLRRILLRLDGVKELEPDHYVVEGRPELGDRYPVYYVWLEGRRWRCTCQTTAWGWSRDICSHVGAVLLYREYRRAMERAERRVVYVAEAEVECPGSLTADGEVYIQPAAEGRGLERFAAPRFKVLIISRRREIKIMCGGHVIYEAEGEEMPYAAALVTARQFAEPTNSG